MDKHILETLRSLRLTLPLSLTPVGSYQTVTRSGEQLIVSGLGPFKDGKPVAGAVGADLSVDDAKEASRLTMLLILACVEDAVGVANIEQCLRLTVYMRAEQSFTQHPLVSDGASDLPLAIFGRERR
jgi:enamine deaminase RidA (YjgF/YER057c/UK114 family)